MKKISLAVAIIVLLAAVGPFRAAFADKNAPPDESLPPASSAQEESDADRAAREKREAEAKTAREAKEAAARRAREKAAAETKRREAARRAENARRAEEARKAASADIANRMINTGIEHIYQGRYQMAVNVLRGYAASNPKSADAWYWIARAHHAMGDYDKAQAAVNIALEIDPYYGPLSKTPSGLEPMPPLTKQQKKDPRPSMSVLPVKPLMPVGIILDPVTVSFPYLVGEAVSGDASVSGDLAVSGDAPPSPRLVYEPYPPMPSGRTVKWMSVSDKFGEIGRWRFRVDRMGILKDPRAPVAWKGTRPYEAYFWTGREWARIPRRAPKERFGDIMRRARGDMAKIIASDGLPWDERDTPALAASASLMRYAWYGDVDLSDVMEESAPKDDESAKESQGAGLGKQ